MPAAPYKKPPIVEAVIEIRFAAPIEPRTLLKIDRQFTKSYPLGQPMKGYGVRVNVEPSGRAQADLLDPGLSYRRFAADNQEMAILSPQSLVLSQLPLYPGWDIFLGRFRRDWTIWKRAAGHREIARVGLRYINRIDIPSTEDILRQDRYLNIYGESPDSLGPTLTYSAQLLFPYLNGKGNVLINTIPVFPPPLVNHFSIMLDIDVSQQFDLPQRDDDLHGLLSQMRDEKNRVFEACITDTARELFR
jgi:uncharacterized protein (TIGR04255 family)